MAKVLDYDGLDHVVEKIYDVVQGGGSADYIVEEGTATYWTYRKWASGLVEMWGSKSFTLNITTSWGNGFYYSGGEGNYVVLSYPSGMFIDTPTCFCQISSSGASVMVMPTGVNSGGTASTPAYHAVRSGSFSNCAVQAEFYVKGYWKTFTPTAVSSTYAPAADYIVAQGQTGFWLYQKWNSGLLLAWGAYSTSVAMTNAINSTYYGNATTNISALGLLHIDDIQVTGQASGGFFASKIDSATTTSITISDRSSASSTTTVNHHISIQGRWK